MAPERSWSIADIDPEAQRTVRDLADAAGLPPGEWLNRVIAAVRESGGGEAGSGAPLPENDLWRMEENLKLLAWRLEELEKQVGHPPLSAPVRPAADFPAPAPGLLSALGFSVRFILVAILLSAVFVGGFRLAGVPGLDLAVEKAGTLIGRAVTQAQDAVRDQYKAMSTDAPVNGSGGATNAATPGTPVTKPAAPQP